MFLWFFAIGLPMLFIGFGLAVDISSMVNINRGVRLAAESASVAGAFQYERNGSGYLDPSAAAAAANETFRHALSVGGVSRTADVVGTPEVTYRNIGGVQRAVGVRYNVSYSMRGFVVLNYWLALSGQPAPSVSVYEQARICTTATSVSGFCGRPDTDRYQYGVSVGTPSDGFTGPAPRYPAHYPPHYPAHYPAHYPRHYPSHYSGHYPRHYPSHYSSFSWRR